MSNLTRAYQCDEQGVLLGETLVQEDPLEAGVVLLPPGCVLIAPPAFDTDTQVAIYLNGSWAVRDLPPPTPSPHPASATLAADDVMPLPPPGVSIDVPTPENMPKAGEHEIAVIVEGHWAVVADWRETAYWLADGSVHRITALGKTPPDGALFSKPSPAPPDHAAEE